MKRFFVIAAAACAIAGPALAGESLNVPRPGAPKVSPQIAVGDRGMAIMSASIVGVTGAVARGEGVDAANTQRFSAGTYEVSFGRDVTECVYTATVGEGSIGSATPAVIGITRRSGNPNGVFVQVRNPPDEVSEDRDFFVLVFCGR